MKRLTAALLAVLVLGGCGTTTGTTETGYDAPKGKASAKKAKAAPGIGDKVRDGKFEFTVTKTTKRARVGNEYLGEKAQGVFVLVHMKIENIGDEAQMFDADSQKLLDAKGRQYSADTAAGIALGDANSFLEEINPGNTVRGIVVFDVPKSTRPTELELHDSMFSDGVKVALR